MRVVPILVSALLFVAAQVNAQPKMPITAEDTEHVAITGKLPDSLPGTWLIVASADLEDGKFANGWEILRITKKDKNWVVTQIIPKDMPFSSTMSWDEANAKQTVWTLDDKVLKEIAAALDKVNQPDIPMRTKKYEFYDADHIPKDPPLPKEAAGTKLLVRIYGAAPNSAANGSDYYLKDISPNRMGGYSTSGSLPTVPGAGVIAIGIHGPATWYRLK